MLSTIDYEDAQVRVAERLLSLVPLAERGPWIRKIQDRKLAVEAGLRRAPEDKIRQLHAIDPLLRLRWDFEECCWIVERAVEEMRCWLPVVIWKDENKLALPLDNRLMEALLSGDMWRFSSPEECLRFKRAAAEKVREQNQRAADEKILEAVDSLGEKRIKNFIEVERALATGETITPHGDDLRFVEHAERETEKAEAAGETIRNKCVNPGQNPLRRK